MRESKDLPQSDAHSRPVKRLNKERKCVNGNRSARHLSAPSQVEGSSRGKNDSRGGGSVLERPALLASCFQANLSWWVIYLAGNYPSKPNE